MTDELSDLFENGGPEVQGLLNEIFAGVDIPAASSVPESPAPEAPATVPLADVARAIDLSQTAFQPVVDELVELYRTLDKTYRKDIKVKLKAVYEKLAALGETFGVSRLSMANLWKA